MLQECLIRFDVREEDSGLFSSVETKLIELDDSVTDDMLNTAYKIFEVLYGNINVNDDFSFKDLAFVDIMEENLSSEEISLLLSVKDKVISEGVGESWEIFEFCNLLNLLFPSASAKVKSDIRCLRFC